MTKGKFYYEAERYFAVEIDCEPIGIRGFPDVVSPNQTFYRRTMCNLDWPPTKNNSVGNYGMDLGLDFGTPADVEGLSNITSFGLFPNPSTDGRFNISMETKQAMKEVSVTVSNVAGQQILSRQFSSNGTTFFREIDIREAAKGIYFLRIAAGDELIYRRVVME